jgi:beta-glucosidase
MNSQNWTLRQKIGQLMVVRASGFLFDHQILYPQWEPPQAQLKYWLNTLNLGGVILLGGSAVEVHQRIKQLQSWSPTPLLVAADIEEGVGQRFGGATWFAPPMALGEIARRDLPLAQSYAREMGAYTAQEALALGINWILAPIADINNNPDNPVINIRAFGDRPEIVSALVTAFIEGAKPYPVLTTAKHFPGHGDTSTDSHLHLPVITHDRQRLETVELPPFQAAITAGVDTVMTAHIRIPVWDADKPATLSAPILTGQLRQKLQFPGLIVTDALIMAGVAQQASPPEVALQALEAGADILLMPPEPEATILAIEAAVHSGRLTVQRLEESLTRLSRAKAQLGLGSFAAVPLQLQPQAAQASAAVILEASGRQGGPLPWRGVATGIKNIIVVDDLLKSDFLNRACPGVTIPQGLGCSFQLLDQTSLQSLSLHQGSCWLQLFVRGNPFRGQAGLSLQAQELYRSLLLTGQVQALILYGSPYVLEWFLPQMPPSLPWVFSYGQMPQAQFLAWQKLLGPVGSSLPRADSFM